MSTTIILEGNLTADPELRFTKTAGQAVTTLRLAVSSRRKNVDGEYEDTPTVFYEATCWNSPAEHAADSLVKGDRVLVHGTSYDQEWTDRDGMTRIKHVLQASALGVSLRYTSATVHRTTKTSAQSPSDAEPVPAA